MGASRDGGSACFVEPSRCEGGCVFKGRRGDEEGEEGAPATRARDFR